jgi:hypothetical protein
VNAIDAFVAQVAGPEEHARIFDAICARDGETMMHRCVPFPRLPLGYAGHSPPPLRYV